MKFLGAGWAALPIATVLLVSCCAVSARAEPAPVDSATGAAAKVPAWAAPAAPPPSESNTAKNAVAQPTPPSSPVAPVTVAINPVVDAVRAKLLSKAATSKVRTDDVDALSSFYGARSEPLWLKDGAWTDKAAAVLAEIKKANDYGLEASAFALPELASGANLEVQSDAELKLGIAVLKYAHFARGGRVDPVSLSNILDMKPPLKEPKMVLTEIAGSSSPDDYLRGLHPKHLAFEKLRQALISARGPQVEEKVDEALKIKIPDGKTIKPGEENEDIALLRKRLRIGTLAVLRDVPAAQHQNCKCSDDYNGTE